MASFTVREILEATGGKLVQGNPRARIAGISTDTRTIKGRELFVAIKGNNFNGHDFIPSAIKKSSAALVVSEKRKFYYPKESVVILVKDTTHAFGDIARFHRLKFKIPVIAITGSNGKTTAKEMIAEVISKKLKVLKSEGTQNNHIGVPLTLLRLNSKHKVAILELGTNHPGEIKYLSRIALPTIAVITNIGPAHLEFFKTPQTVFKEKSSLLQGLKKPAYAILNNDDSYLSKIKGKGLKIISFGIRNKSDFMAGNISKKEDRIVFLVNHKNRFYLNTPSLQNVYNALAAIACARIFKMDFASIRKPLSKFRFPEGRLTIKKVRNVKIIDDTYNANPASLRSAVEVLASYDSQRKILVCADMKELGDKAKDLHFSMGRYIADCGIDALITVGKLARYISEGARESGMPGNKIYPLSSTTEASDKLLQIVRPFDIVLIKGSRAMAMEKIIEKLFNN